ncbi:polyhydroxybutyrate depolymerase [Litoreibacter ponti]|uniref:Polyhydroxybutyrate depolymerase n=1 Tax=Litoreibacter ponti TaxID=1510457 RepID=A0A2T6BJU8_9RHOB|nr:alpha/beta fold hydrolase [Litoreibacter ponti]PTX56334.1 polyhydroxybutyrate depolymerase [Litoreibacter ponti]
MLRSLFKTLAISLALPAAAQDCGPEAPCEIDGGSYHLRLPDGPGPHPVLIWYHGHRGNGASIHRGGGLERDFLRNGFAVLAPNGYRRADGPRSYPARAGAPRDDVAFTFAALEAAGTRATLDLSRVYAGGFSAGGSMAWLLACEEGARLAGMVSVAGALRRPNPTDCAGLEGLPVMQIHGFADGQVPFEGRAIRDWHQGSVWHILERARAANGCRTNPDAIEMDTTFRTRLWDASCNGAPVRLDVHDGGHGLPQGWTARARAFLEGNRRGS